MEFVFGVGEDDVLKLDGLNITISTHGRSKGLYTAFGVYCTLDAAHTLVSLEVMPVLAPGKEWLAASQVLLCR